MSRPLTRREQFAMHAPPMPLGNYGPSRPDEQHLSTWAVEYADALIEALDNHGFSGHDCDDCRNRVIFEEKAMTEAEPEPTALEAAQQIEADRQKNRAGSILIEIEERHPEDCTCLDCCWPEGRPCGVPSP